jgi:hypothetical protein
MRVSHAIRAYQHSGINTSGLARGGSAPYAQIAVFELNHLHHDMPADRSGLFSREEGSVFRPFRTTGMCRSVRHDGASWQSNGTERRSWLKHSVLSQD